MRRRFLISTSVADFCALTVAMLVASFVVFDTAFPWRAARIPAGESILPLILMLIAGGVVGSYTSARAWAGSVPRPSYGRALTIVLSSMVLTSVGLVLTRSYFSRSFLVWTMAVWLTGALAHRFVRRLRPGTESMVVITGEKELVEHLRDSPYAEILEVLDPVADGQIRPVSDGVTIALDLRSVLSDRMAQFVSSSALSGVTVRALSKVYEEHTGRLPIVHLAEGWELRNPIQRSAGYVAVKRITDTFLVLATSPIWIALAAIIAAAVGSTSKGPVIFRQERVGLNGRPFTLYKFRTMIDGAEQSGPRFATPGDPRLTGVGRILRRFRADEIPQLWNVLRGDVSLVGPRPEQTEFVADFDQEIPFYSHRHLVRPGVTGWAQVYYGYADDHADTVEKLSFDLFYVKNMSLWLDLHILGKSVWTVLTGFGAR